MLVHSSSRFERSGRLNRRRLNRRHVVFNWVFCASSKSRALSRRQSRIKRVDRRLLCVDMCPQFKGVFLGCLKKKGVSYKVPDSLLTRKNLGVVLPEHCLSAKKGGTQHLHPT